MQYLNELIKSLTNDEIPMNPCENEDLLLINKMLVDKKLPKAYIEFLNIMGRGTNHTFLRGHSCFMDELLELDEWANELLQENDSEEKLSSSDFVFWMSQGCMFCFFRLDEGENPPIYFYSESKAEEGIYKITNSYTDFLEGMYKKDKDIFKKI